MSPMVPPGRAISQGLYSRSATSSRAAVLANGTKHCLSWKKIIAVAALRKGTNHWSWKTVSLAITHNISHWCIITFGADSFEIRGWPFCWSKENGLNPPSKAFCSKSFLGKTFISNFFIVLTDRSDLIGLGEMEYSTLFKLWGESF